MSKVRELLLAGAVIPALAGPAPGFAAAPIATPLVMAQAGGTPAGEDKKPRPPAAGPANAPHPAAPPAPRPAAAPPAAPRPAQAAPPHAPVAQAPTPKPPAPRPAPAPAAPAVRSVAPAPVTPHPAAVAPRAPAAQAPAVRLAAPPAARPAPPPASTTPRPAPASVPPAAVAPAAPRPAAPAITPSTAVAPPHTPPAAAVAPLRPVAPPSSQPVPPAAASRPPGPPVPGQAARPSPAAVAPPAVPHPATPPVAPSTAVAPAPMPPAAAVTAPRPVAPPAPQPVPPVAASRPPGPPDPAQAARPAPAAVAPPAVAPAAPHPATPPVAPSTAAAPPAGPPLPAQAARPAAAPGAPASGAPPSAQPQRQGGNGAAIAVGAAAGLVGGFLAAQGFNRLEDVRSHRQEFNDNGNRVVREPGRTIVEDNNQYFIAHDENERFRDLGYDVRMQRRGDSDVATYVLPDGGEVLTFTDDNGRLLRRIRQYPDGRQIVIIDNGPPGPPRSYDQDVIVLPPPPLQIPPDRYIVDADQADEPLLYDTLSAPPVAPVARRYTLDEVRYSPDLRARMRSVDLDAITFDTGSWDVTPDQSGRLGAIAQAVSQAVRRNPQEVFLVEGYTDAVGAPVDNLSLSDRRAQAVAAILTRTFQVPPENLTTQGYGAQYLKVQTQGSSQANRRVTIRRITPLLSGQSGK